MAETRRQELEGPSGTRCGCIKGEQAAGKDWQRALWSNEIEQPVTALARKQVLEHVYWSKSTGRKIQLPNWAKMRSRQKPWWKKPWSLYQKLWSSVKCEVSRCISKACSAQLARMAANGFICKIPPSPSYGNLAAGISATSLQIVVCNIISFNVWQLSSLLLVICCHSNSTQELSKLTVTVVVLLCSQTHFLSVWD